MMTADLSIGNNMEPSMFKMPMDIRTRWARHADFPYFCEMHSRTMKEAVIQSLGEYDVAVQTERLSKVFSPSTLFVFEWNGQMVGTVAVNEKLFGLYVYCLQVEPSMQDQGIGKAIMKSIMDYALSVNKTVSLTVLRNTPVRAFYEKLGFKQVPNYDDLHVEAFWWNTPNDR